MSNTFWHFNLEEGIGILKLDLPGTDVNVLTSPVLVEFGKVLENIAACKGLKALVIASAKPRIFIAGADINEIRGITTSEDAFKKAEQGKLLLSKLADLKVPVITVINGACLGGGCELALATDFRTASFSPQVKIGLPEVQLGILPGFGGSIRLPRLLGLVNALPLILSGKMLSGVDALKKGLVDRLFPETTLLKDSIIFAKEIVNKGSAVARRQRRKPLMTKFLEDSLLGRALVLHRAAKEVRKSTKGFYPAPFEIIDLIKKTYGKKDARASKMESRAFARLAVTDISKNLIHLFFLNERYKKRRWTQAEPVKVPPVEKAGVIGAGVMGGGIAQLLSSKNISVRVKDLNEKALAGALSEARKIYEGALKRRKIKSVELENKMSMISVGLTQEGLKRCDVVIEAVVEDAGVKQKVFRELDSLLPPSVILLSNTSALSVTRMAEGLRHPGRVAGLHFFNPVHRMPLVEVIRAKGTSDETLERTIAFARGLGKTVIVTKDERGFLVNRLLMPYLNEAAWLIEEGMGVAEVDALATHFGMPMGPLELVDQVGIDVAYKVAHILEEAFGARMKMAGILHKVKEAGLLGKKSGRGFYVYAGREKTVNTDIRQWAFAGRKKARLKHGVDDALKRMLYIMINEAARCLEEGVIDEAAAVDIGMIFGTGFPPFRGGLLRYADQTGLRAITGDLTRFAGAVDKDRFTPAQTLVSLASQDKTFYV